MTDSPMATRVVGLGVGGWGGIASARVAKSHVYDIGKRDRISR